MEMFNIKYKMLLDDDVHSNKVNHSKYGLIVDKCKILLQNVNNREVVFIRRQSNESTHAFAMAISSHVSRITFDVTPSYTATIINKMS